MAKTTKKLSLILALAVLATLFVFAPTASATVPGTLIFSDDFENYNVHSTLFEGGNDVTVGEYTDGDTTTKWVSAPATLSQFGYDYKSPYGITEKVWTDATDTDNKTLTISGRGLDNTPKQWGTIVLDSFNLDATKAYTFQTELSITTQQAGSAIRFFIHNDGKNYYELVFPGSNGGSRNVEFRKRVNDEITILYTKSLSTKMSANNHWKVKLNADGGRFTWLVEALDGYESRKFDRGIRHDFVGAAIDPNPFDTEVSKIALAAGGQNNTFVYYDNFKIYQNSQNENIIASDNFDDYTADDFNFATMVGYSTLDENGVTTIRNNGYIGSTWSTPPRYYANKECGFGGSFGTPDINNFGVFAEEGNETNKVLKMEGRIAWNHYDNMPTIMYDGATVNANEKIAYSVDINKDDSRIGQRILFMMHDQEKSANAPTQNEVGRYLNSYYALYVNGSNAVSGTEGAYYADSTIMLDKVVGGERINVYKSESTERLSANNWYNVEIKVDGGEITWIIKDKATGAVQTNLCGKYIDAEPFTTTQACKFGLQSAGSYNNVSYFDNVVIRKIADTKTVYNDNFNSYTAVEEGNYVTTNNTVVAGAWTTMGHNWGWGTDNGPDVPSAAVIAGPSGSNVLAVETQAAYNSNTFFVPVEPSDLVVDATKPYTYKFDYYSVNAQGGGGIRFNKTGDKTTAAYYELYFQAGNGYTDGTLKTSLAKRVDDGTGAYTYTRIPETEVSITGTLANNMLAQSTWYSVELNVNGGDINWTVTDKATNAVVQTGSYSDPAPYAPTEAAVALFGAGQNNQFVYFDNFVVTTPVSEEPDYTIFDDKLTVSFTADTLDVDAEKVQVIVAYYDGDTKELLSVEAKEVLDLTEKVVEDFVLNETAGAFAKIYIWNGELADAAPAYEAIPVE